MFWMWFHDAGDTHTWSFMGGTGKFDGVTGEGTTSQISAGPSQLVIGWVGSWKMNESEMSPRRSCHVFVSLTTKTGTYACRGGFQI